MNALTVAQSGNIIEQQEIRAETKDILMRV